MLLLPPDETSFRAVMPVLDQHGGTFHNDLLILGAELPYRRVVVEAGDALYIPPFWWHAVESVDQQLGFTVASTLESDRAVSWNLRFLAVRHKLKEDVHAFRELMKRYQQEEISPASKAGWRAPCSRR